MVTSPINVRLVGMHDAFHIFVLRGRQWSRKNRQPCCRRIGGIDLLKSTASFSIPLQEQYPHRNAELAVTPWCPGSCMCILYTPATACAKNVPHVGSTKRVSGYVVSRHQAWPCSESQARMTWPPRPLLLRQSTLGSPHGLIARHYCIILANEQLSGIHGNRGCFTAGRSTHLGKRFPPQELPSQRDSLR